MGLIQNAAMLANPSANAIRPSDILTAGQQAQANIQAGLHGITGQMAENRKLDAQQRADTAVSGLLQEAPKGTQDPTQFNQMLGLASAYGSQGIKDMAKNAIQSATEGYRTALQQENFGKEQQLREDTLKANIEYQQTMEGLKGQEISNAHVYNLANLELSKERLVIEEKLRNKEISVRSAEVAIQKANADFNKKVKLAEMNTIGYEQDKKGNFTYNPNSPKMLNTMFATNLDAFNKKYTGDSAVQLATDIAKVTPSIFTRDSVIAEKSMARMAHAKELLPLAYSDYVSNNKNATQQDVQQLFGSFENYIATGSIEDKSPLYKIFKKYGITE